MKKPSLLILLLFFTLATSAQIKIFPGGKVSVGTTDSSLTLHGHLIWGPLNIK